MDITVKNIKIAEFASEETLCFEATVYIDGKRAFTAHNQGHGGCNMYYPIKNKKTGEFDHTLLNKAEDWANAQKMEFDFEKLGQIIDQLIEDFQIEKELKKTLKKAALYQDDKIFTYNCKIDHPKIREQIKRDNPDAVILNDLPFDEALEIFKKHA